MGFLREIRTAPAQIYRSLFKKAEGPNKGGLVWRHPHATLLGAVALAVLAGSALALHFTMGMPAALAEGKGLLLHSHVCQYAIGGVATLALAAAAIKTYSVYHPRNDDEDKVPSFGDL